MQPNLNPQPASAAIRRLRDNLTSTGFVDNLDLFIPLCDEQGHNLDASDEIFRNGFWHGKVFLDPESAAAEGRQHTHPDRVRIAHFQTVTPDIVEFIAIQ